MYDDSRERINMSKHHKHKHGVNVDSAIKDLLAGKNAKEVDEILARMKERRTEPVVSMEKPPEKRATELRIRIIENERGVITVDWQTTLAGSEVIIPMRPSHIIGQLEVAKEILERDFYKAQDK